MFPPCRIREVILSRDRFAADRAEVIGFENADWASEIMDSSSVRLNFAR